MFNSLDVVEERKSVAGRVLRYSLRLAFDVIEAERSGLVVSSRG